MEYGITKGKKAFFFSLFSILIFSAFSFSFENKTEDLFTKIGVQPIKDNKKAPNFYLEDLKGKKWELKNLKGKVIFLNFWATWCSPCKEEMPSIEGLHRQFKEKDFIFLTISVDYKKGEAVKEFIEKHHYTFPVLLDPKGLALNLFEVKGIPSTFIIDKRGRMIGKAIGPRNWKSQEVISLVNLMT